MCACVGRRRDGGIGRTLGGGFSDGKSSDDGGYFLAACFVPPCLSSTPTTSSTLLHRPPLGSCGSSTYKQRAGFIFTVAYADLASTQGRWSVSLRLRRTDCPFGTCTFIDSTRSTMGTRPPCYGSFRKLIRPLSRLRISPWTPVCGLSTYPALLAPSIGTVTRMSARPTRWQCWPRKWHKRSFAVSRWQAQRA